MNKAKTIIIIVIIVLIAAAAAWFVYLRFIKEYVVGVDPKLTEISHAWCMSSMYSSEYGYIYDKYSVSKRDKKYYAETDIFDKDKKEQVITSAEITGAEYSEIIKLLEGCEYVRHKAADTDRMDGYMDEGNYSADIIWDHDPDGAWDLMVDYKTGSSFADAVNKSVQKISISFVNEVSPSSVWIIRDTTENRKTSVWGTAMLQLSELEEEYSFEIPLSEDDKYLFRMIDDDGLYYDTDIPELHEGWKMKLYNKGEYNTPVLEIYDADGRLVQECEVFCAAL